MNKGIERVLLFRIILYYICCKKKHLGNFLSLKFAAVKTIRFLKKRLRMGHISSRLLLGTVIILSSLFFSTGVFAQDAAKLFKSNCASCHKPTEQKLIGPGLKGIKDRWPDQTKLIAWIKNSQEFLKTGDAYANKLYEEYNKSIMPAFALSDEEVIALIEWSHKGGDAPAAATAAVDGAPTAGGAAPADSGDSYLFILIGIGILLLILISVLGAVQKTLQALVNERTGVVVPEPIQRSYGQSIRYWISQNKKIVALGSLFLISYVLKLGWDGLSSIGIYQGYAPEQPIKFSHKLHAGENQIACVYCHSGVEKSKHANIPSANVCMNCHMYIQEGPQYGTEEISKIYTALDYNPETRTYGENTKPIQWIRVHSLPDHAYFNHSQHVKVGKIECTECHGPIQEMEVVSQHSPLTMGWCIDCHRETEVDYKSNGYYEELHKKFVEDPSYRKGDKFTVSQIGGLECSKCHY